MRRVSLVLAAIGVVVIGYLVLGSRFGGEQPARYVSVAADRGPISSTVTATGTVNPVMTVQVGTYVSGPIQQILVDFNTPVHKGQLLAKIDPRPFQVKVDDATAALANSRAQLQKDRADAQLKAVTLKRTQSLASRGIVAEGELDIAVSQDRQAQAQEDLDAAEVQSSEAKLREAQVNLDFTDIVSPVDGVVVSRSVDVGQTVAATFQTPTLFLVAEDLTKMQVNASVSESDIGGIADDQDVSFTVDAYPGAPFHGRVQQVRNAPVTLQNVVTYDVIVGVDNQDLRLKPGMTANVTITTASRSAALRVPTSALRFRPPAPAEGSGAAAAASGRVEGAQRVWVLDGNERPRAVEVSTGIADDRFTEIVGGLNEGDRVVTALERTAAAAESGWPSFMPGAPRRGGGRGH
jgi:HlyD family secretion protein